MQLVLLINTLQCYTMATYWPKPVKIPCTCSILVPWRFLAFYPDKYRSVVDWEGAQKIMRRTWWERKGTGIKWPISGKYRPITDINRFLLDKWRSYEVVIAFLDFKSSPFLKDEDNIIMFLIIFFVSSCIINTQDMLTNNSRSFVLNHCKIYWLISCILTL